ncbi:protein of unknown function DUF1285 [Shewanella halifaxensis HAW-EB4]|uniref:DUF1285 domain-containing protein n=1 Tax=Shewanella halifaxensis (strain HAW-EB4) TaxID=458817 RepID=B0TPZ4_SHEHH|nr:DUF1285 domain-containing protein [Shewanella halifaxensis]ABZ76273.1 protein of unknown function DUF1285 [Shewanella halifaxensis HAW-EB4]
MTPKDIHSTDAIDAISSLTQGAPLCAEQAIFEINENGEWFYRGETLPVKFCKLFSTILNRVDGEYFLITPVEKLRVTVAKQALIIVDYQPYDEAGFWLKTSINSEHSIKDFEPFFVDEDCISLTLERGVEARLNRACYYRFIDAFIV